MTREPEPDVLDRAERAVQLSTGGRRESETAFLQQLLRDLGASGRLAPAELLRSIDGTRVHTRFDALEVLAGPAQRPIAAPRPGDWMIRAVPGSGDVGHLSVLASGRLLTRTALDVRAIACEGVQPGQYGLVIEAGAFPHGRSQPFARRWLDADGRAPPHTFLLRPDYLDGPPTLDDTPTCDPGAWLIRDESDFVPEIPKIMRNLGWNVAASFQDFWITGPANQLVGEQKDGKGSDRDLEIAAIEMKWVLNFSRAYKHYQLMISEDVYASSAARALLRNRIVAQHQKTGKSVIQFGDFATKELERETQYINYRALGSSTGGKGSYFSLDAFTVDELIGALGRFAMFVIPKGVARIKPPNVEIEISEVGVYIRDSFDFNDDQPLGAWKKPNLIDIIPNPQATVPTCSDQWINMSNYAYRQYRKRTGKGRDFLVYSDIKTSPVTTSFAIPIKA
jgi:hypothetical protein